MFSYSARDSSDRLLLVVEDNEGDRALLLAAARELHLKDRLVFFCNGRELLQYLNSHLIKNRGAFSRFPLLIMLDLFMPGMDGCETLEALKSNADFRRIPVVILSASGDEEHVRACYDRGAASYIVKPEMPEQLFSAIRRFEDYWAQTVCLPGMGLGIPA